MALLPSALCRASKLTAVAVANHQMEKAIPSFTSTLSLLDLHKNRLKVLADLHLMNEGSTTTILLQNNLLSCSVPRCGNTSSHKTIITIGNRLRRPVGEFPTWISKYEHDPLLWVSGVEGMSLLLRISGAVLFLMLAMVWKLNSAKWLRATSRWQIGPPAHLLVVQTSSHLIACLAKQSSQAVLLLMLSQYWDLYACPQTLASASACLRSSALVWALVFLCWWRLAFHSEAVTYLTMDSKNHKKQSTVKMLTKRLLTRECPQREVPVTNSLACGEACGEVFGDKV